MASDKSVQYQTFTLELEELVGFLSVLTALAGMGGVLN